MIKVCDIIMGGGKSTSSINMMNENPDKRYIYITPYLDEAARIKNSCPDLHFVEPSNRIPEFGFSKTKHTNDLIRQGRNITTTHQAFLYYTSDTIQLIKEHHYTLVMDEAINVLESTPVQMADVQMMVDGGYLRKNGNVFSWTGVEYTGSMMKHIMRIVKSRDLVMVEKAGKVTCDMFYWLLPYDLFTAFDEVYILTYMFEGQSLYYFLKLNGLEYELIGVEPFNGSYRFCEYPGKLPDYVKSLKSKIHIFDNEKINEIGDEKYAMSVNWYSKQTDALTRLRRNIRNYFNYYMEGTPSGKRMWASFADATASLKGKGYASAFVPFNERAVNAYRDRTCLVYTSNVFMNVGEKLFFARAGIEVDEDNYALSILIQWIWRSAIREGEDIYIYIPSKRMRDLLIGWLDKMTEKGSESQ